PRGWAPPPPGRTENWRRPSYWSRNRSRCRAWRLPQKKSPRITRITRIKNKEYESTLPTASCSSCYSFFSSFYSCYSCDSWFFVLLFRDDDLGAAQDEFG